MMNSRSFRSRERRKEEAARRPPLTHTEIMRRKGKSKSLNASGDIKQYKGGTRILVNQNDSYKVYSFNMPSSNGSGQYKITSGNQTIIVLDGVLFVTKMVKKEPENIILRDNDYVTFSKGDVVSFCPNAAIMNGILIESAELKTKKSSDPITNNTDMDVYQSTRYSQRAKPNPAMKYRKEKTQVEREAFGQRYLAARGVAHKGTSVATNVAGIPTSPQGKASSDKNVNPAAAVVEGDNPQPMGDKEE